MYSPIVAVLAFHKIGPPPSGWDSWFYIPESTFASYLRLLLEEGWEPIGLGRFLDGLVQPMTLPERAALLTFDDGYRSMHSVTLPWLERFRAPAVLFVPTDHIGGRNVFDSGVEPDEALCDWSDLRALARAGVAIQSHAASHRRFSERTRNEREGEVMRSKAILEGNLGVRVEAISFPYGDPGPDHESLLRRAGYRAAFAYGGGATDVAEADPFLLPRIAMGPDTDLRRELEAAGDRLGFRDG